MSRQLTVIIVNYNVRNFTEQCLHSVLRASQDLDVEIIVADNASQDDSLPYLQPIFPAVRFIDLPNNLGFSKANNLALKEAKGENILFLNPDTILPENVLQNCLQFMAAHTDCGAIGLRMINGRGFYLPETKRMIPNLWNSFRKLTGETESKNIRNNYYATQIGEREIAGVEILSGAFMMLSKKAVDLTGGFDEDYFMYGEDIDLSYRIIKAGLRNYYLGNNTILHFKGESTARDSAQFRENFYGAMEIFARKHFANSPLKLSAAVVGSRLAKLWAATKSIAPDQGRIDGVKNNYLVLAGNENASEVDSVIKNEELKPISFDDLNKLDFQTGDSFTFYFNELEPMQVFEWMYKHAGKFNFYFHFAGSNSVVGSRENDAMNNC